MGSRGTADRQRAVAETKPPAARQLIVGSSDDATRTRTCWDLAWVAPEFLPIAEHLDIWHPDILVAGHGTVAGSDFPLHPATPRPLGGHVAVCLERAGELLEGLSLGRIRAGGFASEAYEVITSNRNGPVALTLYERRPRFGPIGQPRILVLALDDLVLEWLRALMGEAWEKRPIPVEVDHPLAGMTIGEAREFMSHFLSSTPCWSGVHDIEHPQGWGDRRAVMLEHLNAVPAEVWDEEVAHG